MAPFFVKSQVKRNPADPQQALCTGNKSQRVAVPFLGVREGMEAEHIPSAVCQRPMGKGAKLSPG